MRQLRERGIYKTPDGRQFVACAGILGNYLLYSLHGGTSVLPAFAVDMTGRVVAATQPTRWLADELMDTGRTLQAVFATTPCL